MLSQVDYGKPRSAPSNKGIKCLYKYYLCSSSNLKQSSDTFRIDLYDSFLNFTASTISGFSICIPRFLLSSFSIFCVQFLRVKTSSENCLYFFYLSNSFVYFWYDKYSFIIYVYFCSFSSQLLVFFVFDFFWFSKFKFVTSALFLNFLAKCLK